MLIRTGALPLRNWSVQELSLAFQGQLSSGLFAQRGRCGCLVSNPDLVKAIDVI